MKRSSERQTRNALRLILLLSLVVCAYGCTAPDGYKKWTRTEIYFGRDIPTQPTETPLEVSVTEFDHFVEAELTPFVPGMTVYHAEGQYQGKDKKLAKEKTFVVTILVPQKNSPATLRTIEAAARSYRERFNQTSVLIEHKPTYVRSIRCECE